MSLDQKHAARSLLDEFDSCGIEHELSTLDVLDALASCGYVLAEMGGTNTASKAYMDALPDRAATRAGDPSTSRAAAKSITDLRQSQLDVLFVFRVSPTRNGYTDEELIEFYPNTVRSGFYLKQQSASGIRSRRNELVRAGFLRDSGIKRKMSTGRMAVVWELVPGR